MATVLQLQLVPKLTAKLDINASKPQQGQHVSKAKSNQSVRPMINVNIWKFVTKINADPKHALILSVIILLRHVNMVFASWNMTISVIRLPQELKGTIVTLIGLQKRIAHGIPPISPQHLPIVESTAMAIKKISKISVKHANDQMLSMYTINPAVQSPKNVAQLKNVWTNNVLRLIYV